MNLKSLSLFLLCVGFHLFVQGQSKISPDSLYHSTDGEKIYIKSQIDSLAKYQPGESDMYLFIAKNMSYPSDARENDIQGKVYASFIVETDGSISDLMIIKSLSESCDKEVIRIISSLPNKWAPALKEGRAVRSQYILPVSFKLSGKGKRRN